MRTMKDIERLMIIIRVFLDLNGPATAREIADYVNRCPVNLLTPVTSLKIGGILKDKRDIIKEKGTSHKPQKYSVKV